jgi:hypothetical protein
MMDSPRIRTEGRSRSPLARAIQDALAFSLGDADPLPPLVDAMPGMSGRRYRRLVNRLISNVADPRYLEIGSWAGSTACAALYNNTLRVTCIDNWAEFGGPKQLFMVNIHDTIHLSGDNKIEFEFIESDFRAVDYSSIGRNNVLMYDGPHKYEDQYDGVLLPSAAMDDEFVLIVDDYNYDHVRRGTQDAIRRLWLRRLFSLEIRTSLDDTLPKVNSGESEWHNGYYIAVLQKPQGLRARIRDILATTGSSGTR